MLIEFIPKQVEGGWKLHSTAPLKQEELAPEIRQRRPASAARATYDGPGRVTLTLCEMQTSASAFAVFQSWRPTEGAQAFHYGRLFGIAEGADAAARSQFIRALQPTLPQ